MPKIPDYTPVTAAGVDADDKIAIDIDGVTHHITEEELANKLRTDGQPFETKTADHTLVLSDGGKIIRMDVAGANTVNVPLDSSVDFPIGTYIGIRQVGAGTTTISAAVGVTVNSDSLVVGGINKGSMLHKVAANEWDYYSQGAATALTTLNAPTSLSAGTPGETTATITFTDSNGSPNESGYRFYLYDNVDLNLPLVGTFNTAADATSVNITGLSSSTNYWVKGYALGDSVTTADSGFSSTLSFTTAAAAGEEAEFTTWYAAVTGASGSLTAPQQTAYNDFIAELKAAGVFSTHFDFIQILCGGSDAACKFNLVNPADTDAAYRATFVNSPTFGSTGVSLNGTDEYIQSHWIGALASKAGTDDYHVGVYSNTVAGVAGFTFGVVDGTASSIYAITRATDDTSYVRQPNSAEVPFADATTGKGYYLIQTRPSGAPAVFTYKDGVQKLAQANNGAGLGLPPNYKLVFGARNTNGVIDQFSAKELVLIHAGKSFDNTQRAAVETAVANLMTALGI